MLVFGGVNTLQKKTWNVSLGFHHSLWSTLTAFFSRLSGSLSWEILAQQKHSWIRLMKEILQQFLGSLPIYYMVSYIPGGFRSIGAKNYFGTFCDPISPYITNKYLQYMPKWSFQTLHFFTIKKNITKKHPPWNFVKLQIYNFPSKYLSFQKKSEICFLQFFPVPSLQQKTHHDDGEENEVRLFGGNFGVRISNSTCQGDLESWTTFLCGFAPTLLCCSMLFSQQDTELQRCLFGILFFQVTVWDDCMYTPACWPKFTMF